MTTIPANIVRSLSAAQSKGRKALDEARFGIFRAARATGLGETALHRALMEAAIVDYSKPTVGNIIRATVDLADDASVEDVNAAYSAHLATQAAAKAAKKATQAGAPAADGDDTPESDADVALSQEADLARVVRQFRALVATMGQDALPVLSEAYGDAVIANAVFAATVKANRKAASLATV